MPGLSWANIRQDPSRHQLGLPLPPGHAEHCHQKHGQVAQKELVVLETNYGSSRADVLGALGGRPGPSSHQRRLSPTPATGRQDILKEAPCPHQVLRPCQSPGSIFLFLSNSLQGPARKPQNAELQGQQVRPRGLGAADHSALLCLTKSLTQAQDPSSLSLHGQLPGASHSHAPSNQGPAQSSPCSAGRCISLFPAVRSLRKGCWRKKCRAHG